MRQTSLLYNCVIRNSKILLRLERCLVADYPMTMTPRECLEEFCESVGWRLLYYHGGEGLAYWQYYEFRFERPKGENIGSTITDASITYETQEEAIF